MDCSEAKNEIVALLYGEIDARTRAELEAHLETCASCREERDANRRTQQLLDEWDAPPLLVSASAARAPRHRRWVPALVGVAAAVLAFATLAALGAEARVEHGRLIVSLRWPGAAAASDPVEPVARAVVREELERVLGPIVEEIVEVDRRAAAGQSFLVHAIDVRRSEDAERFQAALRQVALGAAVDVDRTRRALGDVVMWAASNPPQPSGK
jgi:anti-sigma factor RsiW